MQIAVIDIGSNSIRYMEAEKSDSGMNFSPKTVVTTRLAEGQNEQRVLRHDSMFRTAEAMNRLFERAEKQHLPCFCYATSALREASNKQEFLNYITPSFRDTIQILSGDEEARIAYLAACPLGGGLIDIGGGSFQITSEKSQISFPLGCVRIHDICPNQTLNRLKQTNLPYWKEVPFKTFLEESNWTAIGGTATKLAAYSLHLTDYVPDKVNTCVFTQESLWKILEELDSLGEEKRAEHPLLKKRYDTILGSGYLLFLLMQNLHIRSLSISDTDGLEGYAMYIFRKLASK